ncbi:Tetraspanin 74F [Carabus blaptoides fortunei]
MARRKTRDSDCCSVNFLIYVLYLFNVIFLLAGLAVLGVGIWTILDRHQYVSLLTSATYSAVAYILVCAGALVVIVTIIGCCALSKENRPLIICFTFSLLLIFLIEAMVGILAYAYKEQVQTELELNLNNTFLENYYFDPDRTEAIDNMQKEYKCCGAIRFEDWSASRWQIEHKSGLNRVPDSCCRSVSVNCGKSHHPSNIYYSGCIYKLTDAMESHLNILGAVGLGICALQIFGMIFSCCLYVKIKNVLD